jgi:hypothetical protein
LNLRKKLGIKPSEEVVHKRSEVEPPRLTSTLDYKLNITIIGSGQVLREKSTGFKNVVKLTPIPAEGWAFQKWTGDLEGQSTSALITLDSNKSISAKFIQKEIKDFNKQTKKQIEKSEGHKESYLQPKKYKLNIYTIGYGSVQRYPSFTDYEKNAVVELNAKPFKSWRFVCWKGDFNGRIETAIITMDADKKITAEFTNLGYSLGITTDGLGKVIRSPDQIAYSKNYSVHLTALPSPGCLFDHWEGDLSGANNPTNVLMSRDTKIVAKFKQSSDVNLNISIEGSGKVHQKPEKPDNLGYPTNQIIDLTAVASNGWSFDRWEGDINYRTNPTRLVLNSNKTIIAKFSQNMRVNLFIQIDGWGTVIKKPDLIEYTRNQTVELTAVPSEDRVFEGWAGDLAGTENPITLFLDSDKKITANFKYSDLKTLQVGISGFGAVLRNPEQNEYRTNEVVELKAVPAPGSFFDGWGRDLNGKANPANLCMDRNKRITANFTLKKWNLNVYSDGAGFIEIEPNQQLLENGTAVTLKANPQKGWFFNNWLGDIVSIENPLKLSMTKDLSINALFGKFTAARSTPQEVDKDEEFNVGINLSSTCDISNLEAYESMPQNADASQKEFFISLKKGQTGQICYKIRIGTLGKIKIGPTKFKINNYVIGYCDQADVTVKPKVHFTKSLSKVKVRLGERIEVKILLNNLEDTDLNEVRIDDDAVDSSDFKQDGTSSFAWKHLDKSSKRMLCYCISPITVIGEHSLGCAKLTFKDGLGNAYSFKSNPVKLTVEPPTSNSCLCPKCGATMPSNAVFCGFDGTKLH